MEFHESVAAASCPDVDLTLFDKNATAVMSDWPELPVDQPAASSSACQHERQPPTSSSTPSSTKRPAEDSDDSTAEYPALPPIKTAKCTSNSRVGPVPRSSQPVAGVSAPGPSRFPPRLPAFAPKVDYARLAFSGTPSTETKLRWLSCVNKAFQLQRELAEVKMASVTSRFVYISRHRVDILERVQTGEFLSLPLVPQDTPERPRKYPSYIVTKYPVDVAPSLAEQYPGVYSARRFVQDGSPINRIVIVWNLPDPPPSTIFFDFLPCLPPCEVRRLINDQPWCYRCWGVGHISRYCSASPKCAWCAADHDSRTCPDRRESSASTSEQPPPPVDESRWKCPRCLQPGVNVWHGCARRQAQPRVPAASTPPPLQLPTTPQSSLITSVSPQDQALRKSVAALLERCKALEDRFSAFDARIEGLVTSHSTTASKISLAVEAQDAIVSTVTTLVEKVDTLASRVEKLFASLLATGPSASRSSSSTPRSPRSNGKVRP